MSQVYVGQIMMTGFGFAQKNFAQCNGQTLAIAQNQALFSLVGTYYGGNGSTTFQLPDLRSRTPVGGGFPSQDAGWQPSPFPLGGVGGQESVSLLASQIPNHSHTVTGTTAAGVEGIGDNTATLSAVSPNTALLYGAAASQVPLTGGPLTPTGFGAPHPNIQPYETINFNIAMYGVYPSRN
ncbi:MAG: tail fiber protein [Pseudomonadota bacterium]